METLNEGDKIVNGPGAGPTQRALRIPRALVSLLFIFNNFIAFQALIPKIKILLGCMETLYSLGGYK